MLLQQRGKHASAECWVLSFVLEVSITGTESGLAVGPRQSGTLQRFLLANEGCV